VSIEDFAGAALQYVGAPIAASGMTAAWLKSRSAGREVTTNTRQVRDLNDDLRRWVQDRDRELSQELATITNQAGAPETVTMRLARVSPGSQLYAASHVTRLVAAKRAALHQYRDEATRKLREFDAIVESEGRLHRRARRRRGLPELRLALPSDCRETLRRWREDAVNPADPSSTAAVDDPTRPELEPRLRQLEEGPEPDDLRPGS